MFIRNSQKQYISNIIRNSIVSSIRQAVDMECKGVGFTMNEFTENIRKEMMTTLTDVINKSQ
jgi:hypothetical protein